MEHKTLICINCPLGCTLEVNMDGKDLNVSGNTCKRGAVYAQNEITNPKRTITSTIKVINGQKTVVSVKTENDIPKKLIMQAMKVINETTAKAPIKIGDILVKDILSTGVDVIATTNIAKV